MYFGGQVISRVVDRSRCRVATFTYRLSSFVFRDLFFHFFSFFFSYFCFFSIRPLLQLTRKLVPEVLRLFEIMHLKNYQSICLLFFFFFFL